MHNKNKCYMDKYNKNNKICLHLIKWMIILLHKRKND